MREIKGFAVLAHAAKAIFSLTGTELSRAGVRVQLLRQMQFYSSTVSIPRKSFKGTQLLRFGKTNCVCFPVVGDAMRAEEGSAQRPSSVVVFDVVALHVFEPNLIKTKKLFRRKAAH